MDQIPATGAQGRREIQKGFLRALCVSVVILVFRLRLLHMPTDLKNPFTLCSYSDLATV